LIIGVAADTAAPDDLQRPSNKQVASAQAREILSVRIRGRVKLLGNRARIRRLVERRVDRDERREADGQNAANLIAGPNASTAYTTAWRKARNRRLG
jgi:hypothetical protein